MDTTDIRVRKIKASTYALFSGVFGLFAGLILAGLAFVQGTAAQTSATGNLLQGLLFGLGAGFLALIVAPVVYFIIGYLVGYIQAIIFNIVATASGGIVITADETEAQANAQQQPSRQQAMTFGERMPNDNKPQRRR